MRRIPSQQSARQIGPSVVGRAVLEAGLENRYRSAEHEEHPYYRDNQAGKGVLGGVRESRVITAPDGLGSAVAAGRTRPGARLLGLRVGRSAP